MSNKYKQALIRFGKIAGVAVIASAIGWLSGPDAASLIPAQYAIIVTVVLIPALSALEKAISGPTAPVAKP